MLTSTLFLAHSLALNQVGLVTPTASTSGGGDPSSSALTEVLVGIIVANLSHFLSAIALYRLGLLVWRGHPAQGPALSLVAAILHVISPAGLFLTAPYAESSCALLTFTGYLLYARSCLASCSSAAARDGYVILAGVSFGLATAFRSNAILNGIPFAWEVLQLLPRLASGVFGRGGERPAADSIVNAVRRLVALGVGGVAVAAGSVIPQAVAYQRFCADPLGAEPRRPWCQGYLPSIYTFVQGHYW